MFSVIYTGERLADGSCSVTYQVREGMLAATPAQDLPPRLDLRRHSIAGFEWGYHGSGPAQLALALLAHHFRRPGSGMLKRDGDELACALYQWFKFEVVGGLDEPGWTLTTDDVERVLARRQADHAAAEAAQGERCER